MGCDIHLQIEYKRGGKWYWVNEFLPKGLDKSDYLPLSTARNYELFAILANVRNRFDFNPISDAKGLPEDISDALKNENEFLLGDHSYSWLTHDELHNFNWDQTGTMEGLVKSDQFLVWKSTGKPEAYCQGAMGGNILIVSNDEMEEAIRTNDKSKEFYTWVKWVKKYCEIVGWETYWQYYDLKTLIDYDCNDIEDIRIVFGFDS